MSIKQKVEELRWKVRKGEITDHQAAIRAMILLIKTEEMPISRPAPTGRFDALIAWLRRECDGKIPSRLKMEKKIEELLGEKL